MRQFLLPDSWDGEQEICLGRKELRHLVTVLRLKQGDEFPALDYRGQTWLCRISSIDTQSVRILVLQNEQNRQNLPDIRNGRGISRQAPGPEPGSDRAAGAAGAISTTELASPDPGIKMPRIIMAPAILKGNRFDDTVRISAEAEVAEIYPLLYERSIKIDNSDAKNQRYRRIIGEALGQSGSRQPSKIHTITKLVDFIKIFPPEPGRLLLFFHEKALAHDGIHGYCKDVPEEIVICTGPEGGFSPKELLLFENNGFKPVWLGPSVLRAETAAIFALSAIRIVCLEYSQWFMKS